MQEIINNLSGKIESGFYNLVEQCFEECGFSIQYIKEHFDDFECYQKEPYNVAYAHKDQFLFRIETIFEQTDTSLKVRYLVYKSEENEEPVDINVDEDAWSEIYGKACKLEKRYADMKDIENVNILLLKWNIGKHLLIIFCKRANIVDKCFFVF